MKKLYLLLILAFLEINSKTLCPDYKEGDQNISCQLETGSFIQQIQEKQSQFRIVEYNVDRNGFGGDSPYERGLEGFKGIFLNEDTQVGVPDFLILSEVARDCRSQGGIGVSGAEQLARSLKMAFVYGVQYIDLGLTDQAQNVQCTTGNAILSQYPLEKPSQIRFKKQCCMYGGRAGGRMGVGAVARVSDSLTISLISGHLQSGTSANDLAKQFVIRHEQAKELIKYSASTYPTVDIRIISGDFNSPFLHGTTVLPFWLRGYKDSHSHLKNKNRISTLDEGILQQLRLTNLDYIFVKSNLKFGFANSTICNIDFYPPCYGASDHYPIFTDLQLQ